MTPGNDADLFDRILAREGPALRRVAGLYERDPGRSEELLQEILLAVWRALRRFRGESSHRTFVFRIAHNRGLSHRARRPPRSEALEAACELPDPHPGPELQAQRVELGRQLHEAIAELPIGLAAALSLALEGLSLREIAEVTGISESNAAVRLSRARQRLRERLGRKGAA
jgi:RNA polymerase sigma-70 factor (ECF subfamily)